MGARVYGGGSARTTLVAGINSGATAISLTDGSTWPSTGSFSIVLDRGLSMEEKILGTRSGNVFTATSRGYDGTAASAHASGATAECTAAAIDFQEANDHIQATGAVHTGASLSPAILILPGATSPAETTEGSVVWDTDDDLLTVGTGAARKTMVATDNTQTLTNKTLTSPTINAGAQTGVVMDATSTLGGISGTILAAGHAAWIQYTPVMTGAGWAVGNGTLNGYYLLVGKTLFLKVRYAAGSTSTAGSSSMLISLPPGLSAPIHEVAYLNGVCQPAGSTVYLVSAEVTSSSSTIMPRSVFSSSDSHLAGLTSTVPASWTTAGELRFSGVIEVA